MFSIENYQRTLMTITCFALVSISSLTYAATPEDSVDLSSYTVRRDIPYGADSKQVFDLYIANRLARRGPPTATIVFAHGGGYYLSDKSEEEQYIRPFLREGFDIVNTNYRLGQGIFAATNDLSALIRHLVYEGESYGLASNRLVLMGFSAGGQMSANIGFWQNEPDDPFDVPKEASIAAIVNISGPSHNLSQVEQIFLNYDYQPFRELGAALFPGHPRYSKAQVISMVEPFNQYDRDDPPIFLWYGGKDEQVPPSTHQKLLAKFELNPSKNRVIHEPEGRHSPSEAEFRHAFEELFHFLRRL